MKDWGPAESLICQRGYTSRSVRGMRERACGVRERVALLNLREKEIVPAKPNVRDN